MCVTKSYLGIIGEWMTRSKIKYVILTFDIVDMAEIISYSWLSIGLNIVVFLPNDKNTNEEISIISRIIQTLNYCYQNLSVSKDIQRSTVIYRFQKCCILYWNFVMKTWWTVVFLPYSFQICMFVGAWGIVSTK